MPFDLDFLALIRTEELAQVLPWLRPTDSVLELGAGSGLQSRLLHERGLRVVATDVPGSPYEAERVFPVLWYDGAQLPFRTAAFDVVFSSNVLEHVRAPATLFREMHRVLGSGGRCIHLVPTGAWRLWTSVAHYWETSQEAWRLIRQDPRGELAPRVGMRGLARRVGRAVGYCRSRLVPFPHGETGTALSELWQFGRRRWMREFREAGFDVEAVRDAGLFYTGHMVLGPRLSLRSRRWVSRVAGSGSRLFVLRVRGAVKAVRSGGSVRTS